MHTNLLKSQGTLGKLGMFPAFLIGAPKTANVTLCHRQIMVGRNLCDHLRLAFLLGKRFQLVAPQRFECFEDCGTFFVKDSLLFLGCGLPAVRPASSTGVRLRISY